MVKRDMVIDVLRTIDDPEMPISIVDLGIVERVDLDGGRVTITLLPTFVGCLALPAIEEAARKKVGELPGVEQVSVRFVFDPPWTAERLSPAGRERLRKFGITSPQSDEGAIRCPFCGSADVRLESPFGPTRCRMIYHCQTCRNPFEHLKHLSAASFVQLGLASKEGPKE